MTVHDLRAARTSSSAAVRFAGLAQLPYRVGSGHGGSVRVGVYLVGGCASTWVISPLGVDRHRCWQVAELSSGWLRVAVDGLTGAGKTSVAGEDHLDKVMGGPDECCSDCGFGFAFRPENNDCWAYRIWGATCPRLRIGC